MYETIMLGVACLSAPLFAKLAGYEITKKPYDMVGVGGLFFLLGAAFTLGPCKVDFLLNIGVIGTIVSHILGWLMVIIGASRSALDVIMEKDEVPGAFVDRRRPVANGNGHAHGHAHAHKHPRLKAL